MAGRMAKSLQQWVILVVFRDEEEGAILIFQSGYLPKLRFLLVCVHNSRGNFLNDVFNRDTIAWIIYQNIGKRPGKLAVIHCKLISCRGEYLGGFKPC